MGNAFCCTSPLCARFPADAPRKRCFSRPSASQAHTRASPPQVKPSWLESLPDETSKCRSGDVFTLLVDRILVMIVEMSEGIINEHIISFLRNAIGWLGVDVNDICIPYSDKKLCPSDPKMLEAMFGCSPDHKDAHARCYYERQRAVCLGKDDSRDRYEALFDSPSASELEQQFRSIVGDTYESIPPAMMQAFKDADASTTGYNRAAASLCDNSLADSMSLDDIILSCVFHNIETFCPGSQDDDELDTYVKTIDWKLPKVRWNYFSSPPPPPPVSFGAFHDLVAADPDGMELLREMLLDAFPSLTYVASQTYGNPTLSNATLSHTSSHHRPAPGARRLQRRSRVQPQRDRLRTLVPRLALHDVHGLPRDGALSRPRLAQRADRAGALHGHVSLLV